MPDFSAQFAGRSEPQVLQLMQDVRAVEPYLLKRSAGGPMVIFLARRTGNPRVYKALNVYTGVPITVSKLALDTKDWPLNMMDSWWPPELRGPKFIRTFTDTPTYERERGLPE